MAGSYECWVGTNNCSQPVDVRCICGHNRKVSGCKGTDTCTMYHLTCINTCMYTCKHVPMQVCGCTHTCTYTHTSIPTCQVHTRQSMNFKYMSIYIRALFTCIILHGICLDYSCHAHVKGTCRTVRSTLLSIHPPLPFLSLASHPW